MDTGGIDFIPWGLEADWPTRRWLEIIDHRRRSPAKGIRLGHANDHAMILTCTFPRGRFEADVSTIGSDPIRELAFETTFAQVNLALHQIRVPGARPDGLIGSLVSYANQQADRYLDWSKTHWGVDPARTTSLAGWQSGFSLAYPDVYVVVHACGISIDRLRLMPVQDLSGYEPSSDPLLPGAMHWELWPSGEDLGYDELARLLVAN
jgi:hypothetical protein